MTSQVTALLCRRFGFDRFRLGLSCFALRTHLGERRPDAEATRKVDCCAPGAWPPPTSMLLAGDPVTFTSVARTTRVSTWLVYAVGVREHIESAIAQQRSQPDDRRSDDPASIASLRTDLALARSEIARLRADNDKLRRNAQRLLGQQLDQHDSGELLARVDSLVAENRGLNDKLLQSTQDRVGLQKQITELEEDIAAARTALRRMIKEKSSV